MSKLVAGITALSLGALSPVFAGDMPEKTQPQTAFRYAVTQPAIYTLASALAYGSPLEVVLVEKDKKGHWKIPDNLSVLFWSGPKLEPGLDKQLAQSDQAAVDLMDAAGVQQLPKRTPADWVKSVEDGEKENDSWGQGYGMVRMVQPEGAIDTNYWLDPLNAMAALETIKMVFQGMDQRNHWAYDANSDQIVQALWEMDVRISKLLHDVSNQPVVVLQDEFHYLEQRYKLITVPAGGSAQDIVAKANARGAKCVVATEPLDQQLKSVLDKASLNSVVLDPAGKRMPRTTGAYFKWFGYMISELNSCMKNS